MLLPTTYSHSSRDLLCARSSEHVGLSSSPCCRLGGAVCLGCLVDLLLLIDGELARAAVDEQKQATDDGQDLEEVVLGKVLVGVVLVELLRVSSAQEPRSDLKHSQSRSC